MKYLKYPLKSMTYKLFYWNNSQMIEFKEARV